MACLVIISVEADIAGPAKSIVLSTTFGNPLLQSLLFLSLFISEGSIS